MFNAGIGGELGGSGDMRKRQKSSSCSGSSDGGSTVRGEENDDIETGELCGC
jgi:hypothetical protein